VSKLHSRPRVGMPTRINHHLWGDLPCFLPLPGGLLSCYLVSDKGPMPRGGPGFPTGGWAGLRVHHFHPGNWLWMPQFRHRGAGWQHPGVPGMQPPGDQGGSQLGEHHTSGGALKWFTRLSQRPRPDIPSEKPHGHCRPPYYGEHLRCGQWESNHKDDFYWPSDYTRRPPGRVWKPEYRVEHHWPGVLSERPSAGQAVQPWRPNPFLGWVFVRGRWGFELPLSGPEGEHSHRGPHFSGGRHQRPVSPRCNLRLWLWASPGGDFPPGSQ